jgi:hypothetical protein
MERCLRSFRPNTEQIADFCFGFEEKTRFCLACRHSAQLNPEVNRRNKKGCRRPRSEPLKIEKRGWRKSGRQNQSLTSDFRGNRGNGWIRPSRRSEGQGQPTHGIPPIRRPTECPGNREWRGAIGERKLSKNLQLGNVQIAKFCRLNKSLSSKAFSRIKLSKYYTNFYNF